MVRRYVNELWPCVQGVDDGKRFTMTVDALKVRERRGIGFSISVGVAVVVMMGLVVLVVGQVVGVEESQVQVMMSVLAGVLHVGNIELRSLDDDK